MENRFTKTWWHWCFAGLLTACTGCWEEVHYSPTDLQAVSPVLSDRTEEPAGPTETQPPVEPPAVADTPPEVSDVTADELFGASEESPSPPPAVEPQEPILTDEESPVGSTVPETADETLIATENEEPITDSAEVMRPSRTALAVWRMSSRWSFAAAIYAKGQPEERYQNSLEQATFAAELVGVELPAFPVREGMSLEAAVIGYLLDAGPAAFVNKLSEDYVPEYEALAELAIRTNALLLVYTPKSQQLDPLIASIRQSAESSGLPAELWTELISMLERREPFDEVKRQVLSFHTKVADYLAGEE